MLWSALTLCFERIWEHYPFQDVQRGAEQCLLKRPVLQIWKKGWHDTIVYKPRCDGTNTLPATYITLHVKSNTSPKHITGLWVQTLKSTRLMYVGQYLVLLLVYTSRKKCAHNHINYRVWKGKRACVVNHALLCQLTCLYHTWRVSFIVIVISCVLL
jgi:hypothetical protein